MRPNTFRAINGTLLLEETKPYTGENETEKALVYFATRTFDRLTEIGEMICDDDDDTTVIAKLDEVQACICSRLDSILDELRRLQTSREV